MENYNGVLLHKEDYTLLSELEGIIGKKLPILDDPEEDSFGYFHRGGHVVSLVIKNTDLKLLPEAIVCLKFLKFLKLENAGIISLPGAIGHIESLEKLYLSRNKLKNLPKSIGMLIYLWELYLDDNELLVLPESIGSLDSLEIIQLEGNLLTSLPKSIGNITYLEKLYVSENNLTDLPKSITDFEYLELLDLSDNSLRRIPRSIGKLNRLEELYLSRNRLEKLPKSIGNLKYLWNLQLDENNLTFLPRTFKRLKWLEVLQLDKNNLKSLPKSFGKIENVETVYLSRNKLTCLPKSIGRLESLEFLQLDYNNLDFLPDSIGKLRRLSEFYLTGNNLKELPESIGLLKSLEVLSLDRNFLKSLPESLGDILFLQKLYLQENLLNQLPNSICDLSELKKLDLSGNNLISIPNFLGELKSLDMIRLNEKDSKLLPENLIKRLNEVIEIKIDLINYQDTPLYKSEYETLLDLNKSISKLIPVLKDPEKEFLGIYIEDGYIINLNLKRCRLQNLPNSIGKFKELEKLNLSKNELNTLPQSIGNLAVLRTLNLSKNNFKSLPDVLWKLKSLKFKNFKHNPWEYESQEIMKDGIATIKEFCRKKASIHIFISHCVSDFEKYKIRELAKFLESQDEIYKAFYCERDMMGDMRRSMQENIAHSQILLLIASQNSIFHSESCKYELELADTYEVDKIPICGSDITWETLEKMGLNRNKGVTYLIDEFNVFCEELYNYLKKYKRGFNLFEKRDHQVRQEILAIKNLSLSFFDSFEFKEHLKSNLVNIKNEREMIESQAKGNVEFLTKLFKDFYP